MHKLILAATAALLTLSIPGLLSAQTLMKAGFNADTAVTEMERRKKRIPGGSGCDSPRDVREHPECRI